MYCDPKTIDSDVPLFYAGLFKPPSGDGPNDIKQTVRVFVGALYQWQLIPLKGTFVWRRGNIAVETIHEIVPAPIREEYWTNIEKPLFAQ